MRIAVMGLGTVGQQVVSTLLREKVLFAQRIGEEIEISHVLVRDADKPRLPEVADRVTVDPEVIFSDQTVELVVEVMGGHEPARSLMARALRSGRSVVTANKEVIAAEGPELALLGAPRATLLFEAAVAGGIPIIRGLQESLAGNRIRSLFGIVNGSTNFLLTRMHDTGDPFAVALQEAKALGYLEADPSDDLDGVDAARKVAILAGLSFGGWFPVDAVERAGIRAVSADDVRAARQVGGTVKLLARAEATDDGVSASVAPTLLRPGHPLARVDGPQNAVYLQGEPIGEVLFAGLGAGGASTSSAVIGDIIASARMRRGGGRPPELPLEPAPLLPPGTAARSQAVRLTARAGSSKGDVADAFASAGIGIRELYCTMQTGEIEEYLVITEPDHTAQLRDRLDRMARSQAWMTIESCLAAEWDK